MKPRIEYVDDYIIVNCKSGSFKIDREDESLLKEHYWSVKSVSGKARPRLYAASDENKFLHRVLMNPPKGLMVDHINRDTLDNRKSNLRIVTARENILNSERIKIPRDGSDGGFITTFFKKTKKGDSLPVFAVSVCVNKKIYSSQYNTKEKAQNFIDKMLNNKNLKMEEV